MRLNRLIGIALLVACVAAGQQSNSANHSMTINGVDGPAFPILNSVRTSLPATFIYGGLANQPYALWQGITHQGAKTTPYGIVDLFLSPLPVKILDGFANPAFHTDSSGAGYFTVQVPPNGTPPNGVPLTLVLGEQSIMGDPFNSPYGVSLTAATRVAVTQGPIVTLLSLGDDTDTVLNMASMPIPFYGTNYTNLYLGSNGYLCFGAGIPTSYDYTPWPSYFTSGPPILAPFWSDLYCGPNAVRTTLDTNPGSGVPGYLKIEFMNVGEGYNGPYSHTFSMLAQSDGYLEITSAAANNGCTYDQTTGIGPGNNILASTSQKNFVGAQPAGSSVGPGILTTAPFVYVGAQNESFYEWFGVFSINPYYSNPYDNPFDLFAITLHFQPGGSGTAPATTNRYTLY